jgi:hypothetical protein
MSSPDGEKVEQFLRNVFRGGGRRPVSRMVAPILLVFVLLFALQSSFYTIDPEEVGVVLRFGQHVSGSSRRSSGSARYRPGSEASTRGMPVRWPSRSCSPAI